jgi:hypothetical protein
MATQRPCYGTIAPSRNSPRRNLRIAMRKIQLGIELPKFSPRSRIQRNHMVVRRAEQKFPVNENRRGFKRRLMIQLGLRIERASTICPRHPQLRNIVSIDLRQRRIPRTAGIIPVIRPPGVRHGLRTRDGSERQHGQAKQNPPESAGYLGISHARTNTPRSRARQQTCEHRAQIRDHRAG